MIKYENLMNFINIKQVLVTDPDKKKRRFILVKTSFKTRCAFNRNWPCLKRRFFIVKYSLF